MAGCVLFYILVVFLCHLTCFFLSFFVLFSSIDYLTGTEAYGAHGWVVGNSLQ